MLEKQVLSRKSVKQTYGRADKHNRRIHSRIIDTNAMPQRGRNIRSLHREGTEVPARP